MLDTTMFWSARGGGVRRYLLAKRAHAHALGWRHTLVAPGVPAGEPGAVDCGGWPIPRSGGYRLPWRREASARLIAAQAPDLIEAGDPGRLAWAARDAAQRLRVPSVFFCHGHLPLLAGRLLGRAGLVRLGDGAQQALGGYLAQVCEGFDLVLAPSRWMQRELLRLGVNQAECQPLGVDLGCFDPSARDETWRASLGLPPDAKLVVYAGRFAPEKRLPLLVAAVERLGPRARLLALGDGPRPPKGPQVIVQPHAADASAVARALASADVFAHAGDQETFGLAALEAMACGTPVVLAAAAGLGELAAQDCGTTVASDRPDDWAAAIAAAFTAAGTARARHARARAETHAWPCVLQALARRYEALAEAHARRAARAGGRRVDLDLGGFGRPPAESDAEAPAAASARR